MNRGSYNTGYRTARRPDWLGHKNAITDSSPLYKLHIGIVKSTLDPQRMGRIMVHIPELGGDPNSPENWILASYCSPFAGATYQDIGYSGAIETVPGIENPYDMMVKRANNRTPTKSDKLSGKQSYGMWFVAPDLENKVVIAFINGDPNQAIWMGCMFHQDANRMVPGAAEGPLYDKDGTPMNKEGPTIDRDVRNGPSKTDFDKEPRREFTPLMTGLIKQGLDGDNTHIGGGQRGQAKSTPHREAPSEVFGIMTPSGNHLVFDDGVFNENTAKTYNAGNRTHELIRLRTKSGVQLLLNETDGFVYMITKDGRTWLELSNDGNVDIYGASSISMHAHGGDINLKAGNNINLQAGMNINIAAGCDMKTTITNDYDLIVNGDKAVSIIGKDSTIVNGSQAIKVTGQIGIQSGSDIRLDAGPNIFLNSGAKIQPTDAIGPASSTPPGPPKIQDGIYVPGEDYPEGTNINSRVPQHEPWTGRAPSKSPTPKSTTTATKDAPGVQTDTENPTNGGSESKRSTGNTPPSIQGIGGKPNQADVNTAGVGKVGPLTEQDTDELVKAIAYTESRGRLDEENSLGFLGRYQFGAPALADVGYIDKRKWEAAGSPSEGPAMKRFLNNPDNWKTPGGKQGFLQDESLQNKAMGNLMRQNYRNMEKQGVINDNSSKERIGAALYGAHLGGASGSARVLKGGADASDAFGTSISKYQSLGYSVFAEA